MRIGLSREGRPIEAFRFGTGPLRVSLVAGCHADEPVGPRFLRRLTDFFSRLPDAHPLLAGYQWWIIPHMNPDGEVRNAGWQAAGREPPAAYSLASYLAGAVREAPGDDIEFGFPRDRADRDVRPENLAAWRWWRSADGPFSLHASLHGMGFAAGPWFLVEAAWQNRCRALMRRCRERVRALGYTLHDVERGGEKGFFRLGPGFCTRPDSRAMREHFRRRGDAETAARFKPSSMEAIRRLGGDPLTLVSEMPLFLTPGVGERLGPPDPVSLVWMERLAAWREALARGVSAAQVDSEARRSGLRPMPVRDQMDLQWTLVRAGLEQVGQGAG
ncbi:MAG: M14 family zinc carboxypeptidase [Gemmatimonadota bacterium]